MMRLLATLLLAIILTALLVMVTSCDDPNFVEPVSPTDTTYIPRCPTYIDKPAQR